MNNLKKALGAAALVSVLAMTACGNDGSTSSSVSDTKTSATSENTTESQTTSSAASKSTTTSIVTTTAATTTTIAESTTVKTEAATNDAQGQDQDVDLSKRKDYIEQDERNIYSRCSIFGVAADIVKKHGPGLNVTLPAVYSTALTIPATTFGPITPTVEGADYEGSMTAFGFNGKGYYTIADDKTSTKVYLMTDENGEVVGVVFTDFNKSSIPVAGNATDIGYGLNPEKHLALSSIRSDYEQFASEHTRYSYNFVTEDGYENGYSYERYNDEYYSMFFSMNVYYGESVDTYAVMDNRFIKENPDLKLKE